MHSNSGAVAFLWWLVCLNPLLHVLLALSSSNARSADEALGGAFFSMILFMLMTLIAIGTVIRVFVSSESERGDKVLATTLLIALIPMFFVNSYISYSLGWQRGGQSLSATIQSLVLLTAWIVAAVALKKGWFEGRK